MSTRTLTLNNMITYCNYFDTANYPYYNELREAFHILNITGCRVSELFEIWRWSHVSGYEYQLQPQKGNNTRSIVLDSLCSNFMDAIENQYSPFLGRTVNQFEYLYNRVRNFGSIVTGDKPVSLYLFRYKYIKKLQSDGLSLAQIASIMGYTSTDTPTAYLSAILVESFIEPPFPFVSFGVLDVQLGISTWNDGNGGIAYAANNPLNANIYDNLYTYAAAVRYADSVPGFRLPTAADFEYIRAYIGTNVASVLSSNPSTWLSNVLTSNVSFGLSGVACSGCGYLSHTLVSYYLKQQCYLLTSTPSSDGYVRSYFIRFNSLAFTLTSSNKVFYNCVRLVRSNV